MIKAFSHTQGEDIFILNSYGFLVHRWSRRNKKHLQDYKVIAQNVSCKPAIIYLEPNYHIFYIKNKMALKHLQINLVNTFQRKETEVASQIDCNVFNLVRNNETIYIETYRKEKPVYLMNRIIHKQLETSQVHQNGNIPKVYQIMDKWQQIEECTLFEDVQKTLEAKLNIQEIQQRSDLKIKLKNQQRDCIYLLNKNCISKINMKEMIALSSLESAISLQNQTKLGNRIIDVIEKGIQSHTTILFAQSPKELTLVYSNSTNQLIRITLQLKIPFKNAATLLNVNQTYFLLYLDQNQQLIRCPLVLSQQNKIQVGQSQSRPYLVWQDIQSKCIPLGEQGYHADCYLYRQHNLVIKKFRKPSKAFKSNREVYYLKKIEQIQPNLYHHDIISQGIITGFSLTYFPGQNWYNLTSQPDHLLNRSPIARVQLVIKLGQFMRKLQSINFCHGDLHLENVIIHIQEQDAVYPKMTVKVIDFGNGFEMFEGETVSEGLTGFSPIVPPQAQFSYKKNYNPWGLNAYQFGRISLQILLKNGQRNLCKLDYTPLRELESLKQNNQYPANLHSIMKQLVHYEINLRNLALLQNISHLESQTRQLYLQNHKS